MNIGKNQPDQPNITRGSGPNMMEGVEPSSKDTPLSVFKRIVFDREEAGSEKPDVFSLMSETDIQKNSLLTQSTVEGASVLVDAAKDKAGKPQLSMMVQLGASILGGGMITGGSKGKALDGTPPSANFKIWKWLVKDYQSSKVAAKDKLTPDVVSGMDQLSIYSESIDKIDPNGPKDIVNQELRTQALGNAGKVRDLKVGHSHVFYGGYVTAGAGGHAEIYEIKKISDRPPKYDIFLYTSTGHELISAFQVGATKQRQVPVAHYANVDESELFTVSNTGTIQPKFIQAVMELKILGNRRGGGVKVAEETGMKVFDDIEKHRVPVDPSAFGLITGQRGGTCVPSVTKVYLRCHSPSEKAYKTMMFHAKLRFLVVLFDAGKAYLKDETEDSEKLRRLLIKTSKNLLRRIGKAIDDGIIDQELALQARATAHDVLQQVSEAETAIDKIYKDFSEKNSDISQISPAPQIEKRALIPHATAPYEEHVTLKQLPVIDLSHEIYVTLPSGELTPEENAAALQLRTAEMNAAHPGKLTQKEIAAALQRRLELTEEENAAALGRRTAAMNAAHPGALTGDEIAAALQRRRADKINASLGYHVQRLRKINEQNFGYDSSSLAEKAKVMANEIHWIIDQLPIDQLPGTGNFLEGFTADQLTVFYSHLNTILRGLYPSCYRTSLTSRHYATTLSLMVLCHAVYCRLDSLKASNGDPLSNYRIPNLWLELTKMDTLQFFDAKEFARIQNCTSYLKNFNKGKGKDKEIFSTEGNCDIDADIIKEDQGTTEFWTNRLNNDPAFKKAVLQVADSRDVSVLNKLTEAEIEADYKAQEGRLADWHKKYAELCSENRKWTAKDHPYLLKDETQSEYENRIKTMMPHYGFNSKPVPTRKVNPSDTSRCLALLQCSRRHGHEKFMYDNGYGHVYELRKNLQDVARLMYGEARQYNAYITHTIERPSPITSELELVASEKENLQGLRLISCQDRETLKFNPIAAASPNDFIIQKPQFAKRERGSVARAEADILDAAVKDQPLLTRLYRTLAQWELTPMQILYELNEEREALKEPDFQQLVIRFLFRSPLTADGMKLGAGEMIVENDAFFEQAKEFIRKGLAEGSEVNGGTESSPFYLELSYYLSKYLKDAAEELVKGGKGEQAAALTEKAKALDRTTDLKDLLSQKITEDRDRKLNAFRLHKVLSCSLKPKLTKEDYADILFNWIAYQSNKPEVTGSAISVPEKHAADFMLTVVGGLKEELRWDEEGNGLNADKFAEELNSLGNEVFARLEKGGSEAGEWNFTQYGEPFLSRGSWAFNLTTGETFKDGVLNTGKVDLTNWRQDPEFQRLLGGDPGVAYSQVGNSSHILCHSKKGNFRLKIGGGYRYNIYKEIDGVLCKNCEKDDESFNDIPNCLRADHSIWMTPRLMTIGGVNNIKGVITDLMTQETRAYLLNDGTIVKAGNGGVLLNYLQTGDGSAAAIRGFSAFDAPKNILTESKPGAGDGTLEKIRFPRYLSSDNNELSFHRTDKGQIVWSENPEFAILDSMNPHFLGTVNNYLFLQSTKKNTQGMLLVPFQQIGVAGAPIAEGKLAINNTRQIVTSGQEKPNELLGNQRYFVLEVADGKINPVGVEAKLFLSYIYLSQKWYEKASDLLHSLQEIDKVSPTGMRILEMISQLPLGEDDPNAHMVQMHAMALHMSRRDASAKEPVKKYFDEKQVGQIGDLARMIEKAALCLQSSGNLSAKCRISRELEVYLLSRLLSESADPVRQKLIHEEIARNELQVSLEAARMAFKARSGDLKSEKVETIVLAGRDKQKMRGYAGSLSLSVMRTLPELRLSTFENWKMFKIGSQLYHTIQECNASKEIPKPTPSMENCYESYKQQMTKWYEGDVARYYQEITNTSNSFWAYSANYWSLTDLPYLGPVDESQLRSPDTSFFTEVYALAKNGTKEQRDDMLYRLLMWRKCSDIKESTPKFDALIMILHKPESFPKLPANLSSNSNTDVEARYKALYDIQKVLDDPVSKAEVVKLISGTPLKAPDKISPVTTQKDVPFPVRPQLRLEPQEVPLADVSPEKVSGQFNLAALDPALKEDRWDVLSGWKRDFLKKDPHQPDLPDVAFPATPDKILKDYEANYTESLQEDLKKLKDDYDTGMAGNLKKELLTISTDKQDPKYNQTELKKLAGEKLSQIKTQKKKLKKEILKDANEFKGDALKRESWLAKHGGRATSHVSIDDCVNCLLSGDLRTFQQKNEGLREEDAKALTQKTLELMDLKSYQGQLERTIKLLEQIASIDEKDPDGKDAGQVSTRRNLCQMLETELDGKYHFDQFDSYEEKIAFRVFAGQAKILPFAKQTALIKQMMAEKGGRLQDIVIQLIMGGGKTSVIATILLYMTSKREGSMGCFIVPASLFDVVKANLGASLRAAFGKQLLALDLTRESFTAHQLAATLKAMKKAQEEKLPYLISASTLQGLNLEFLSLSTALEEELKTSAVVLDASGKRQLNDNCNKIIEKMELISDIIAIPKLGLLDEVDITLDSKFEVNYVEGNNCTVDPLSNEMLQNVFTHLTSNQLTVEIPTEAGPKKVTLNDYLQLRKNKQSSVPEEDYKRFVVPVVAEAIWNDEFSLVFRNYLGPSYKDAFVRMVSGKIPAVMQDLLDENEKAEKGEKNEKGETVGSKSVSEYMSAFQEEYKTKFQKEIYTQEQADEDYALLKKLKEMYVKGEGEKEASKLIARTKHFLIELLPTTLSKEANRNYGLATRNGVKKIVPYVGNKTPATTDFGYHWEAACYYYQYGLAFPPEAEAIKEIAETTRTTIEYYVKERGEAREKTPEYKEFTALYGVGLYEIDQPGMMERAIKNAFASPERMLEMQYRTILAHVKYANKRLTSNGCDLTALLETRQAMSGTPWNAQGYAKELADHIVRDKGTEGSILHVLAARATDDKILQANFSTDKKGEQATVTSFLDQIYTQYKKQPGRFKRMRALIDAAGLFKNFGSHQDVAKGWLDFLSAKQDEESAKIEEELSKIDDADPEKKAKALEKARALKESQRTVDPNIKAVLFFHKAPGQETPNTLYAWKKGESQPIYVGGTSKEILATKGLKPEDYVMYYDENHKTGVDVLLSPDCVGVQTMSHQPTRDVLQAIMRLRQYFREQDIDFVVDEELRSSLVNQGQKISDLILNAAKVESIRKTDAMVSHFTQQVKEAVSRSHAVKMIREAFASARKNKDYSSFAQTSEIVQPFYVTTLEDDAYALGGRLKREVATEAVLRGKIKSESDAFKEALGKLKPVLGAVKCEEMSKGVDTSIKTIDDWVQNAKDKQLLPKTTLSPSAQLGFEQEVAVEVHQEKEQMKERHVDQEIEQELERYQNIQVSKEKRHEYEMDKAEFEKLLNGFKTDPNNQKKIPGQRYSMHTLNDQLGRYKYDHPYSGLFSSEIYGTDNYFHAHANKALPVFHKMQRPPKQILAIKTNNPNAAEAFRFLLLSEHEARDVKKHMEAHIKERERELTHAKEKNLKVEETDLLDNVWLIHPDGEDFVLDHGRSDENPHKFIKNIDELGGEGIAGMLTQINAFAGNMSYINREQNEESVEQWLTDPEKGKLRQRFLELKACCFTDQKDLLASSIVLAKIEGQDVAHISKKGYISKARMKLEMSQTGKYTPEPLNNEPEQIKTTKLLTDRKKLIELNINWVKYLGIDYDLRKEDPTKAAVEKLQAKNPAKYGDNLEADTPAIRKAFQEVTRNHFKNMRPFQVGHVTPQQLKWLPVSKVAYLKQAGQICTVGADGTKTYLLNKTDYDNAEKNEDKNWVKLMLDKFMELPTHPAAPALVPGIDPAMYKAFTKSWQIEAVPDESLIKIDENCGNLLTENQIIYLIKKELPKDANLQFFDKLFPKISQSILTKLATNPECRENLQRYVANMKEDSARIQNCSNALVQFLREKQLLSIKIGQVVYLVKGQFVPLYTLKLDKNYANQEPNWTAIQAKITPVQIKTFDTTELINLLTGKQIKESLEKNQVPLLDKDHVKDCPDKHVPELSKDQFEYVELTQIPYIGPNQVKYLKFIPEKQENQIARCPNKYVNLLDKDQFEHVTLAQIPHIGENQVKYLRDEPKNQIECCPDPLIKLLTQEQFKHIKVEQIKHIVSKQVPWLKNDHVKHCPAKLVCELSVPQLQHIIPDQVKHIGSDQVQHIKNTHVPHVINDLVGELSNDQMKYIAESQVGSITKEQVPYVPNELVNSVPLDMLHLLTKEQMKNLTNKTIDAYGFERFNKLIDTNALWGRITPLTPKAVSKLNIDKVKNIRFDVYCKLEKPQTIKSISRRSFVHLTKNQLAYRKRDAVIYTLGVFTLGLITTVAAIFAYMAIYPFGCLVTRSSWKNFRVKVNPEIKRIPHYFRSYLPGLIKKVPKAEKSDSSGETKKGKGDTDV